MNKKKMNPLITIILGALILSAGLGLAAWYWTSQVLTYTMTIDGQIVAYSNFGNGDLVGTTTYAELESVCVTEIFEFGDQYIIRVVAEGGNPTSVYTSLELTLPGTSTATANVHTAPYVNGVIGTGELLGSIATDGTESVQVTYSTKPTTWFLESDFATGNVNVLYFIITINWDLSLPIGSHETTAIIRLGDSI